MTLCWPRALYLLCLVQACAPYLRSPQPVAGSLSALRVFFWCRSQWSMVDMVNGDVLGDGLGHWWMVATLVVLLAGSACVGGGSAGREWIEGRRVAETRRK